MTGVSPIGAASPATPAHKAATLDQASFLKLMTTQLKTQDPFQPMDSQQMVAQMAQFSNVAGISEMNAALKAIAAKLDAGRIGDASGWLGRNVLIASDFANRTGGGDYAGQVTLDAPADAVTIDLLDTTGLIVHTQTLGAQSGTVPFAWDGKRDGAAVTGPLRVRVSAHGGGRGRARPAPRHP